MYFKQYNINKLRHMFDKTMHKKNKKKSKKLDLLLDRVRNTCFFTAEKQIHEITT